MPQKIVHLSASSVVKAILVIVLFYVLFLLRDLILIVLAAVVFASAIEPMTRWFKRYHVPRVPAVLVIYIAATIILLGSFYFLLLPLLNETAILLSDLPQYLDSTSILGPVSSQPFVQGISETFSVGDIINQVNNFVSNVSTSLFSTLSYVFGGLFSFVLIIVLSFYLAVQENGILNFLRTITPMRNRDYILDLWKRSEQKIGYWLQGQILLIVIIAVLTYLGLTLFGVEHALLLAFLSGLFELIPLFGPILAAIPAIAIAFSGGGVTLALLAAGLYVVIQQFENHLLYPLVVNKVVGVPAIIVIIALVAGATLAGFLGVLLSVPLAAVLMEIFHDLQKGVFSKRVA